jgi:integrase/recombinase XerD
VHPFLYDRVLPERFDRRLVTFLTEPELDALLAVPNRSKWTERRDYASLGLAAQTGLRVFELISLQCSDIHLGTGAHASCLGKGRKWRITPLRSTMVAVPRVWLEERGCRPTDPLFASKTGKAPSRDALEHRLAKYVEIASCTCPSLGQKSITHEQIEATQIYLHADLELKERALRNPCQHSGRPLSTAGQAACLP